MHISIPLLLLLSIDVSLAEDSLLPILDSSSFSSGGGVRFDLTCDPCRSQLDQAAGALANLSLAGYNACGNKTWFQKLFFPSDRAFVRKVFRNLK